MTKGEEST
jgi:hypothetical protein